MLPQITAQSNAPTQQDIDQSVAYVAALTGNSETVMDFMALNETNKALPGIPRRGTLVQHWNELCDWNNKGYGIYTTVAVTNGTGRLNTDIVGFRANYIDLDGIDANQQYADAQAWNIKPTFSVQSSPGKWHVYWLTNPHNDPALQERIQRKLITKFNSDPTIVDAARIMRLPGTFHCKGAPEMVQCFALAGMGQQVQAEQLDLNMWDILPSQAGGTGDRIPVGEGERAPTTKAAADMLYKIDVANITDRNQWAAIAGAFMQSVDPADMDFALMAFLQWNESYPGNDPSANIKLWNDLLDRGTSVKGWGRLHKEGTGMTPQQARLLSGAGAVTGAQEHVPVGTSDFGPILDSTECAQYFDGCVLISSENVIFTPKGMKYPPEKFNATFGGKAFIITQGGKTTDEPWKAVTRSQLWMVPKVEYTCFRPDLKTSEITTDELGRNYVNTYLPANIARLEGDPTPFLNHLIKLFPVEDDREILIEYLAHNAQFPGHKIPWAPLIQSGEGAGKNAIKKVLRHVIGQMYFYVFHPG